MKKIAYLGIPGTYSHLAANEYYKNNDIELIGCKSFKDIFTAVTENVVDYGIVPVENSLAGSVYDNYDLLYEHTVQVIGETFLHINLNLLGIESSMPEEVRLEHIRKVVSQYKALEQVEQFLSLYPAMQKEFHGDTAGAAKFVADQKDPFTAAVASRETAKLYGLTIIKENIHDNADNYTRFLIIANTPENKIKANRCSLIFTLPHTPGSLYEALKVLAEQNLNLLKIESRPIAGKPFEYIFYVDVEWKNRPITEIESGIESFRTKTQSLKILGFYEAGSIPSNL